MKILFIGDIVGKIGRQAMAQVLPKWRKQLEPYLVIANVENIAHGVGLTIQTFAEVKAAGVDFFTTGNHWARKSDGLALFQDSNLPLVRPLNWAGNVPGVGYKVIEVGTTKVAIINIMGQIFMHEKCDNPFQALDKVLAELPKGVKIILVDFHAEATSEKQAFGWHASGRVSAVLGTHTHVPTADERILSGHTAYITDVGMCGATDSVIGDTKDGIIQQFLDQLPRPHDIPESGEAVVNAVVLEIDNKTCQAAKIARIQEFVSF